MPGRNTSGVTPGRGGQEVLGVPVFDTVQQAFRERGSIDISVLFVSAPLVKAAALKARYAGIKLLVIVPDRVPLYDGMEIAAVARSTGATFVGPNTQGVLSPGEAVLGMMGGREWAASGKVGITSRSAGHRKQRNEAALAGVRALYPFRRPSCQEDAGAGRSRVVGR